MITWATALLGNSNKWGTKRTVNKLLGSVMFLLSFDWCMFIPRLLWSCRLLFWNTLLHLLSRFNDAFWMSRRQYESMILSNEGQTAEQDDLVEKLSTANLKWIFEVIRLDCDLLLMDTINVSRTITNSMYRTPVRHSIHYLCNVNNTPLPIRDVASH